MELRQASKFGFYKLIECVIQKICHDVKQNAKICAIGETECDETSSLYIPKNLYLILIVIKGIVIRTIHNIYVCMYISVDVYLLCMIKVRVILVVCEGCYNLG